MNHYFIIKFLFLWFVTLFNILKFDEKNNLIIVEKMLINFIIIKNNLRSFMKNVFYFLAAIKFRFVAKEIRKLNFNLFVSRTLMFAITDTIKGTGKYIKQILDKK